MRGIFKTLNWKAMHTLEAAEDFGELRALELLVLSLLDADDLNAITPGKKFRACQGDSLRSVADVRSDSGRDGVRCES
jgi:hypothetical protein